MLDPQQVRKFLNSHGYGFQYAVLRRFIELSVGSPWRFEVAEFPVGALQNTIHTDFILRAAREGTEVYLVAECKRADPKLANWCFVKAPYTRRGGVGDEVIFEIIRDRGAKGVQSIPWSSPSSLTPCDLGFAMRTGEKGDGVNVRGDIENATTQVLRAMNGLVDHLFAKGNQPRLPTRPGITLFLPVIFTTAALWIFEGDLSVADPKTGYLPDGWGSQVSAPWLWFNHNQSPALRHQLSPSGDKLNLARVLRVEYTRSIAVVSPEGIEQFSQLDPAAWPFLASLDREEGGA